MENKYKTLYVIIVILVVLLFCSFGYILYLEVFKEDEVGENNNNTLTQEEEIAIIEKEVNDIFEYFNEVDYSGNDACLLLGTDYYYEYEDNLFLATAGLIMDCYYGHNYPQVYRGAITRAAILTDEEIADYQDYFDFEIEFLSYEPIDPVVYQEKNDMSSESDFIKDLEQQYELYNGKDYKIAYSFGDGYNDGPYIFELTDVVPSNDKYIAKVTYTTRGNIERYTDANPTTFTGEFEVDVVDGHCKFGEFIIV